MRLLTRSDFDGICCAVLLKELGVIDEMVYAHPKDLQDGKVEVTENDVLANVPYVEGAGLWFDHHTSEDERLQMVQFKGMSDEAASAFLPLSTLRGRTGMSARGCSSWLEKSAAATGQRRQTKKHPAPATSSTGSPPTPGWAGPHGVC